MALPNNQSTSGSGQPPDLSNLDPATRAQLLQGMSFSGLLGLGSSQSGADAPQPTPSQFAPEYTANQNNNSPTSGPSTTGLQNSTSDSGNGNSSGGVQLTSYPHTTGTFPSTATDFIGPIKSLPPPNNSHSQLGIESQVIDNSVSGRPLQFNMMRPRYADLDYNVRAAEAYRRSQNNNPKAFENIHDWFLDRVNTGQPMDYKQLALKHPLQYPHGSGYISKLDNFGNFNYGAVGAALGLSLGELTLAAKASRAWESLHGNSLER